LVQKSQKPDYDFGRYFVDRFARIYSGLLPALAFIVILGRTDHLLDVGSRPLRDITTCRH
jgi:hypothetical protein